MFNLFFFFFFFRLKGKKCVFFGFKRLPPKMGLGLVVLRKYCQHICSWSCLAHAGMSQMFSRAELRLRALWLSHLAASVWKVMLQRAWAAKTQASTMSSSVSEALVKRGTALCLIDEGMHFRAWNAKIPKPLDPGALAAQVCPSSFGTNHAGAVGAEPRFF